MVARLIHRHAAADRHFPGARAGQLADLVSGDVAIFGADPIAAWAIRDAANAHTSGTDGLRRWVDLGDLRETAQRLPSVLHDIEARGARPVMLGGDPDLGTALIGALAYSSGSAPGTIILLSPRLDVRLPQDGNCHAAAIGTQRLVGRPNHAAWRAAGGTIVPVSVCDAAGSDVALAGLSSGPQTALLIVDLAVIDTGYAAGASSRNVGGLSPMVVLDLADRIIASFDVRALALLNLAPERDPRGHSERIAAMIVERVGAQATKKQAA